MPTATKKSTARNRSARSAATRTRSAAKSRPAMKSRAKASNRAGTKATGGQAARKQMRAGAKKTARTQSKSAKSQARGKSQGKMTTDHDEIRQWVESRGGTPATVMGTERDAEAAGLLRIDFPGYSGEGTLQPIDWDEFFEKFDASNLAFLYDDKKGSKFNKFVERETRRRF